VNKTVAILTVGVAAFVGGRLPAQQPQQYQQPAAAPAASPLRTKIGLLNLSHVIKSYTKYQAFEREWQETLKGYDKTIEGKRSTMVAYQKELEKQLDQATRDKYEGYVRQLQREMQDVSEDAKKQLSKKRDEQAIIIYKEIEHAVQVYARAQDIDLVLHFNDAIVPQDLYSPVNIQRKLQIGACMPMYSNPQMDITQAIITMLNSQYASSANAGQQVQPAAATAPAPPAGPNPQQPRQ
jgi:Skp family chaperone for outer membrane proteins